MHILYFGCLVTDLHDFFYKYTTLYYYGNYVSEGYPTKMYSYVQLIVIKDTLTKLCLL